jgi:hypothetical protein
MRVKRQEGPGIHNKTSAVVSRVEKHLRGLGSIQPLRRRTIFGKTRLICATSPEQRDARNVPWKRLQIQEKRGCRTNYTAKLRMNPFGAMNILLTARQKERGQEKAARPDRTDEGESDPLWNSISQRVPIPAGCERLHTFALSCMSLTVRSTHGCCPREWICPGR